MISSDFENLANCFSISSRTLHSFSLVHVEFLGLLYTQAIKFYFFHSRNFSSFDPEYILIYQIRILLCWVPPNGWPFQTQSYTNIHSDDLNYLYFPCVTMSHINIECHSYLFLKDFIRHLSFRETIYVPKSCLQPRLHLNTKILRIYDVLPEQSK